MYVKGLGACSCYTISGYSQHDALVFPRPSVFLVTEAGQYELTTPSAQYAPFFAPVQEKVEVCKRLVRAVERSPALGKEELLAAVARDDGDYHDVDNNVDDVDHTNVNNDDDDHDVTVQSDDGVENAGTSPAPANHDDNDGDGSDDNDDDVT